MTVSPALGREGGAKTGLGIDKGSRGVGMEGEGVILRLSLDKEEASNQKGTGSGAGRQRS